MPAAGDLKYPIILGRRNCRVCTRWRLQTDYRWRWKKVAGRVPSHVDEDGRTTTASIETTCTSCKRKIEKKRYHALPVAKKRAKIERDYELKFAARHELAEVRAKLNNLQYATEGEADWDLERKRNQLRKAIYNVNLQLNHGSGKYKRWSHVSFTPFRLWLLRSIRQYGNINSLARTLGRDEAQVRRWADGIYWEGECDPRPISSIDLGTVDDVLTRLELPHVLNELYPFVEELTSE